MTTATILEGDCLEMLKTIPPGTARTCVTSPPYFGLRDYGNDAQIGLESTPDEYLAKLVAVFREVRRVLTGDGTLWLNLGDSYTANGKRGDTRGGFNARYDGTQGDGKNEQAATHVPESRIPDGLKPKDLIGIPWRVAFALQADGWYLRSDIIWSKPNPMPESVTDRPTKAHEYLFLLAKSAKYFYDADAVREPISEVSRARINQPNFANQKGGPKDYGTTGTNTNRSMRKTIENFAKNPERGRNRRTVWEVATKPYTGAHFAVMPSKLVEPCVLAGSADGDTVIDPFTGSGTVAEVALKHGRNFIGCELNPEYIKLAQERIAPFLMQQRLF